MSSLHLLLFVVCLNGEVFSSSSVLENDISPASRLQIFCSNDHECIRKYREVHKAGLDVTNVYNHVPRVAARYRSPSPEVETLVQFWLKRLTQSENIQNPLQFAREVESSQSLLGKSGEGLADILTALRTFKIEDAGERVKGRNIKVLLRLEGGTIALLKPNTFDILRCAYKTKLSYLNRETVISVPDRHTSEIAAFHLSLLLDMKTVPIATGRKIGLMKELHPVARPDLAETFFMKGNNSCFYGVCKLCNKRCSICAYNDTLEVVLMLWAFPDMKLDKTNHPWARNREKPTPAYTVDKDYCSKVASREMFVENPHVLMDLIDTSVFDFIIQNGDRHQFIRVPEEPFSKEIRIDNGKGFESPFEDHFDILSPLLQCCRIRYSTYNRLLLFVGGGLSSAMARLLSTDPLSPVLSDLHLRAMDRRLHFVLAAVENCREKFGKEIFV